MDSTRSMFDQAVALTLTLHGYGTTRTVPPALMQVDPQALAGRADGEAAAQLDKTRLHTSKRIMEAPVVQEIRNLDKRIREYLASHALANVLLRPGVYLVPASLVVRLEAWLQEQFAERDRLKARLKAELALIKAQDRQALGPLYREGDYPTTEDIDAAYRVELRYLALDVPTTLQTISRTIFERETEKARAEVQLVAARVEQVLIANLQETFDYLVERLSDRQDGKPKRFKPTMLDEAREFFATFKHRNLTGSAALNELADQGLTLLEDVDLDRLKSFQNVREDIRTKLTVLQERLENMITVAPKRAMKLTDDDHELSFFTFETAPQT
jgi:hypothetical protein